MKFIAEKVFDTNNKDSLVSHYLIFKYKKKYWRNIFLNLGRTSPVPIATPRQKEFRYQSYEVFRSNSPKFTMRLINNEIERIKRDIFDNGSVISPQHVSDLYDYYLRIYKNNTRSIETRYEFLSFLSDKCIDVSELLDESNDINFFAGNLHEEWVSGALKNFKFTFLHSDKVDTISNSSLYTALMTKGYYLIYTFEAGAYGFYQPYFKGKCYFKKA